MTNSKTQTSIHVLRFIIVGLCLAILFRVFQLQVIEYKTYTELGERNSIRQEYIKPARGLIYDKNGVLIVDNEPIYTITIIPANFDIKHIPLLAKLLAKDEVSVKEKIKNAQKYSWYRTSVLYTGVDFNTFSIIQENAWQLPGISYLIESKRHYPTPMKASHVLGYLREASPKDYDNSDELRLGDKIGKSGLEMVYENELKGDFGIEFQKVNALGQMLGKYEGEHSGLPPRQGNNIVTTLDSDLQIFAEKLMEGKKGAVVAMDPNTGAILALVSSPEYDIRKLTGHIDVSYWQELNTDANTPLYNRAISSRQPPGSTFKPLMGIVGLHLGIITPKTTIYNSGSYERGRSYKDLAPKGSYMLSKAITYSSNTFFLNVMDNIATGKNFNTWSKLVKDFGLGVTSEIDLPNANQGIVPDSAWMDQRFGKHKWGLGDLINLGIGQGVLSVSPIQIAQMTSTIANGGYKIHPHLVSSIISPDGSIESMPLHKEKIEWVKDYYIDEVKKGMRGVVLEGSGRFYANVPGIEVAGKTGTAQNPHGFSHGWFTSFAPLSNPEIVVTVFIENAGFASISAAPVASLIIEKYLAKIIQRKYVYDYVLNFVPREDNSEANTNE